MNQIHNNQQPIQPPAVPQAPGRATREDPDIALAIVSLCITFILFIPPVSLILAIIAQNNSKKRGYKNSLAKASIYVNAGLTVLGALLIALFVWLAANSPDNERYEPSNDSYRLEDA